MKKIIFLFLLIAVIPLLSAPNKVSATEPGIPEPPPPTRCEDYDILTIQDNWFMNGSTLVNQIAIKPHNVSAGTNVTSLQVSYMPVDQGKTFKIVETKVWPLTQPTYQDAKIYTVMDRTNNQVCYTNPYNSKYYAMVGNDNRIIYIVWQADNNVDYDYVVTDQNGQAVYFFNKARCPQRSEDIQTHWFSAYLNYVVCDVKNRHPVVTAASPSGGINCANEFNSILREIEEIRRLSYYFATNGCEEATPDHPCDSSQAHRYFRPKNTGESIPDTMIAYQQAFKEMIQADPGGIIAALAKNYEIESLIFTDEGIQLMQRIGNLSISVTNREKTLEAQCQSYINDPKNYPQTIRGYDPNHRETIRNWQELKAIADKTIRLGQLVGQNPTTTVTGPLGEQGWMTKVINTIKCWLRNGFIIVLQWEANAMGWFLRRNY